MGCHLALIPTVMAIAACGPFKRRQGESGLNWWVSVGWKITAREYWAGSQGETSEG